MSSEGYNLRTFFENYQRNPWKAYETDLQATRAHLLGPRRDSFLDDVLTVSAAILAVPVIAYPTLKRGIEFSSDSIR